MPSPVIQSLYDKALQPPSFRRSSWWKESSLSASYLSGGLDRVKVLGGDDMPGHTGCVNALSWGKGGDVLISSGDDTNVRIWRMDPNNPEEQYPFICETIINTGHRANVFNAQMLPNSSRIATVAGDRQVRVFDHERAAGNPVHTGETEYSARAAVTHVIRCHSGRVKRIVTEDSPDLFLTVAEDGTVRQHDLRVTHLCGGRGSCPAPLVRVKDELSSISLSPLTPYQFVVAGSLPYGYLFDRRHAGRQFHEEWGRPPAEDELTTCVRRFGRKSRGPHESKGREHVTGTRMASSNGHEVLLSYSADAVYLYSTRDDPEPTNMASQASSILSPNRKANLNKRTTMAAAPTEHGSHEMLERDAMMDEDIERFLTDEASSSGVDSAFAEEQEQLLNDAAEDIDSRDFEDAEVTDSEDDDEALHGPRHSYSTVPIVMPRSRYAGICNVETIKDVNFLGPRDEFVVSGSDDGSWFMWEKATGRLHNILEGDGSVVNVIEGHPHLPLVAVSGIDYSVKLFAPTFGPSRFSQMDKAESIMNRNTAAAAPGRRGINLSHLLRYYQRVQSMAQSEDGEDPAECNFQ